MTTDTAELTFNRALPLPPDQLWHLLTDAETRGLWNAPGEGMVMDVVSSDFKTGGLERHRCGSADAPEFEVETRWYRIDAPTDAVFTETVEIGGSPIATSLVTYRLLPVATGSDLHITVAISSFVGAEAEAEFKAGWEAGLNNLETLAKSKAA